MTAGVTAQAVDTAPRCERAGRRALAAATVGGIVESFDWTIYAICAPYFAAQMFPGDDPVTQLMAAYLGFAVGFAVRPFGSYVMGRLSDSRGRRFALMLSMIIISGASLLIAALPTAATIGVTAPVLLITLRLVQGVSMGGENPSAAAYVTETAPPRLKFVYSAISYSGVIFGNIIAFGVLAILLSTLGKDGVSDGGWRIAFVAAAAMGLLAMWVRRGADESEAFEEQSEIGGTRGERRALYRANARNMAAVFVMTLGITVGYYFGTTYLPQYATQLGITGDTEGAASMLLPLVVLIVAMVTAGRIADKIGEIRAIRIALCLMAVLTVPLMTALATKALPMWLVTCLYLMLVATPVGVANVLFAQLFPVAVRTVAMGVPFTLGVGLFGGTFPLLAEAMGKIGHLTAVPWWAAGAALIACLGTFLVRRPQSADVACTDAAGKTADATDTAGSQPSGA